MRFKLTNQVIIGLIVGLSSCFSNLNSKVLDDKGISYIQKEDQEMLAAIERSRSTFPEFIAAIKSGDTSNLDFAIKMSFKAEEGNEHMWLNNISIRNDKVFGVVNNDPELTKEVDYGDTIEINRNRISDWYYRKENKLYGGYSIRLLRDRMTPEERVEFDKSTGFIIE